MKKGTISVKKHNGQTPGTYDLIRFYAASEEEIDGIVSYFNVYPEVPGFYELAIERAAGEKLLFRTSWSDLSGYLATQAAKNIAL